MDTAVPVVTRWHSDVGPDLGAPVFRGRPAVHCHLMPGFRPVERSVSINRAVIHINLYMLQSQLTQQCSSTHQSQPTFVQHSVPTRLLSSVFWGSSQCGLRPEQAAASELSAADFYPATKAQCSTTNCKLNTPIPYTTIQYHTTVIWCMLKYQTDIVQ